MLGKKELGAIHFAITTSIEYFVDGEKPFEWIYNQKLKAHRMKTEIIEPLKLLERLVYKAADQREGGE